MSIRTKVLGLVDVMMRVPPIVLIDEILKIDMGLSGRSNLTASEQSLPVVTVDTAGGGGGFNATDRIEQVIENATVAAAAAGGMLSSSFGVLIDDLAQYSTYADLLSFTSIKFAICLFGLICASCIFMLWTRHLVMVYMFVIGFGLTVVSYWSNISALRIITKNPGLLEDIISMNTTRLLDTGGVAMSLLPHLVAQWFMGLLFAYIHLGPRYAILQKFMPLIFASPILVGILPLPPHIIKYIPVFADFIPLSLSKITVLTSGMEAGKTIFNGYRYAMNFVSNFGLSALIENEWQRLNMPNVLRVFWTIRIAQEFISMAMGVGLTNMEFLPTMQKLLVDGCETLAAVLGMTSVISIICHYIGKVFQWYLLTYESDEEKSLGTVSAVLFYILALQTGLTSLSPDKRFVRLCRNLCLLFTALFHFLHNMVSPIMMSLSAARNPSRKRHVRALTVCAFLVVAPITLLTFLWSRHSPSTWLLAVTAFSVEVIVKVLVSLATYTLFLLDARRPTFWEKLDDYLYYVRAFGNSVEFCFGILLFFNGAWILIFESGGAIRAIMMCIHAYFNIWCEARAGWTVFMKRRSAVHKISALPEATPAQLQTFDDVCAICYQEMYSAKITRCRHFFHGVCLRKWLYVQDRCPLCHEIMMYTEKGDDSDERQLDNAEVPIPIYPRDDGNAQEQNRNSPEHLVANASAASSSQSTTAATTVEPATSSTTSTTTSGSTSSSSTSASAGPASTASSTATAAAAAVATAAASNTTHSFRLSPDFSVHD